MHSGLQIDGLTKEEIEKSNRDRQRHRDRGTETKDLNRDTVNGRQGQKEIDTENTQTACQHL